MLVPEVLTEGDVVLNSDQLRFIFEPPCLNHFETFGNVGNC
jgi:hypothetical protein